MSSRYSLRFVSGERAGETVPIQGSPFVVGRKPGSSFQLLLKSVSGRHAEFLSDGEDLQLRDLGSTNGTRVDGKRVDEARLRGGERLAFGDVEFELLGGAADASSGDDDDTDEVVVGEIELELELESPEPMPAKRPPQKAPSIPAPIAPRAEQPAKQAPKPAPAPEPAPSAAAGAFELEGELAEAPRAVSASNLERAASGGSKLPLLLLGLGALAAGGAWWMLGRGGEDGGASLRAVAEVPGNVLSSGSFEDPGGWSAREDGSDTFRSSPGARRSGARGLRVDLGPGGSAFHDSDPVAIPPDSSFVARASLRRGPDASVALGVAFLAEAPSDDDEGQASSGPGAMTVWCPAVAAGDAYTEVEVSGSVPRGYRLAQVVVGAGAVAAGEDQEIDAWAEVDDVSLVIERGGAPSATLDEIRYYGAGSPASALSVIKIDAVLVSGLRVRLKDSFGPGQGILPLELEEQAQGLKVSWSGAGPVLLTARLESRLVDSGIATLGGEGYNPRAGAFETDGVTDLLAGTGRDLLRFAFGDGVRVSGSGASGGMRVEAHLPAKGSFVIQSRFREEREEAMNLATSARQATARGQRGEALGLWKELLTRYPYEADGVAEADAARSTLVQGGLEDLAELGVEVERARFFGLADLYRRCRTQALAIERTYSGSEVASAAADLAAALDTELSALAADGDRTELLRLEAIRASLAERSAPTLAGALAAYIAERSDEEEPDPESPVTSSEDL